MSYAKTRKVLTQYADSIRARTNPSSMELHVAECIERLQALTSIDDFGSQHREIIENARLAVGRFTFKSGSSSGNIYEEIEKELIEYRDALDTPGFSSPHHSLSFGWRELLGLKPRTSR